MPNQIDALDDVFRALSDPTRRAVVRQLSSGPASVSELAEPFDMALPSFVQHLNILQSAGLVSSIKVGRVRTCKLVPETLTPVEEWLTDTKRFWAKRIDALENYLADETAKDRRGKAEP
ncbi:MAG: metalloregulator ArsR/SmtB family transcription factor [Pseudomonadota bacterium]